MTEVNGELEALSAFGADDAVLVTEQREVLGAGMSYTSQQTVSFASARVGSILGPWSHGPGEVLVGASDAGGSWRQLAVLGAEAYPVQAALFGPRVRAPAISSGRATGSERTCWSRDSRSHQLSSTGPSRRCSRLRWGEGRRLSHRPPEGCTACSRAGTSAVARVLSSGR